MRVCVLYENEEWNLPYLRALEEAGCHVDARGLHELELDLSAVPDADVYINRFSPSAFWRASGQSQSVALALLAWLEARQKRVVSGLSAMRLEISKVVQYFHCQAAGLPCPPTHAATRAQLSSCVEQWPRAEAQLMIKPNCGGSGNGVHKVSAGEPLEATVLEALDSPDGLFVVQEFVESAAPVLLRLEFVQGALLYALRVRTSSHDFNNCPSDTCVETNCPLRGASDKFSIDTSFPATEADHALVASVARFMAHNRVDIAGVEIISDPRGQWWVVDCNCVNTNYNAHAEKQAEMPQAGIRAMVRMVLEQGPLATHDD